MRGVDERTGSLFSFVDLEARVPKRHSRKRPLMTAVRWAWAVSIGDALRRAMRGSW